MENISLDTWAPTPKTRHVPKSAWRQNQNNEKQETPSRDDVIKIKLYQKKGYKDYEIMEAFGISAEILIAIKRDCYHPVDGISLDNEAKIYKEFERITKRLDKFYEAFKFIADNFIDKTDTTKVLGFKALIGCPLPRKKEAEEDNT